MAREVLDVKGLTYKGDRAGDGKLGWLFEAASSYYLVLTVALNIRRNIRIYTLLVVVSLNPLLGLVPTFISGLIIVSAYK